MNRSFNLHQTLTRRRRSGFTILEVVISMGIAIFGLLAVLALVPFAARQSKRGLDLDDSTTLGHRAVEEMKVRGFTDPNRWAFPDYNSISNPPPLKSYTAFSFFYQHAGSTLNNNAMTRFFWDEAVLIDPMLRDPGPTGVYADRIRFPYTYQFSGGVNGFDVGGTQFPFRTPFANDPTTIVPMYCLFPDLIDREAIGPGVRRVCLTGLAGPMSPAALLEIFDSKDDLQIQRRDLAGGDEGIFLQYDAMGKPISGGQTSWVAMVVPQNAARTHWKLFVIVLKDRDPLRETNGNIENEREAQIPAGGGSLGLARLESWGTTTSGLRDIMVNDINYSAGDWVLLTQFRPYTDINGNTIVPPEAQLSSGLVPNPLPYRRVYEWYRVTDIDQIAPPVNPGDPAEVPWRWVSLQGPPWRFDFPTLVTSFRGVKAVYERSFTVPDGSFAAPVPMP